MPFRKRSKSLDHFDVQDDNLFKPQRVVSFKLFAQEQISRLTTLCPFLTQEQIALKVKAKWNRMADDAKQNYTKAVLFATPSRKSPCNKSESSSKLPTKEKILNSKTKVADWLNDVKRKQSKDVDKTYESSKYVLQYDVPTVIDPTPSKQPGILKTGSSEKKENKTSDGKGGNRSRVSFTNSDEKQDKTGVNKKSKTKLESKFTNIDYSFKFDNETSSKGIKKTQNSLDKQENVKRRNQTNYSHLKGIVFEEKVEDELFTTPEMVKLPLQEISKAPRKRKTSGKKGKTSSKSGKAKKMKVTDENKEKNISNIENEAIACSQNTNNSTELDVFGNKPWAASTYTRKAGSRRFTPEKLKKEREPTRERNSKRKGGAIIGPVLKDSDENYDEDSEDFVRNERGLIVGPIGLGHNEDLDDEEIFDDNSENEEPEIKKKDHPQKGKNNILKKKGQSHVDPPTKEVKKKSTKTRTNTVSKKEKSPPKRKTVEKTVYKSDFDFEENTEEELKAMKEEENTERRKTINCKKTRDKLHLEIPEGSPANYHSNSESGSANGSLPYRSQLVSLCKDFSLEKPISPVISDAGDSNMTNVTEKSSPARPSGGGSQTLMKVLLKMKQITSPNILDFGEEESPKLLSPTLSGISELSSLSTTSIGEDTKAKNALKQQPKKAEKRMKSPPPSSSNLSRRSRRSSSLSNGRENVLCGMFQDLSPPEMKSLSKRRLVSSNRNQQSNNFSGMFEDEDIFR